MVIPQFDSDGLLPPGIQWATWHEIADRFGGNPWRLRLIDGLRDALESLKTAGCRLAYINGSFVTSKPVPNDYDACWEEDGVDPMVLDPVLLTFDPGRATQRAKYMGELFPASYIADANGVSYIEFFQADRENQRQKGIIAINLRGFT